MTKDEITAKLREIAENLEYGNLMGNRTMFESARELHELADEIESKGVTAYIYYASEDVKHALEINDEG